MLLFVLRVLQYPDMPYVVVPGHMWYPAWITFDRVILGDILWTPHCVRINVRYSRKAVWQQLDYVKIDRQNGKKWRFYWNYVVKCLLSDSGWYCLHSLKLNSDRVKETSVVCEFMVVFLRNSRRLYVRFALVNSQCVQRQIHNMMMTMTMKNQKPSLVYRTKNYELKPISKPKTIHNHGRRSVGGQRHCDFSPSFLKWRGTPCVSSLYFFGGRHFFVLMHTVFVGWLEQFSLNLLSTRSGVDDVWCGN